MERPPPLRQPVDLVGHHLKKGRASIHKLGSTVYGLITPVNFPSI